MYYCFDCECEFDKPVRDEIDRHPYGDGYAIESGPVCPHCGSTNYEKMGRCDECGDLFPESQIRSGLCPNCYKLLDEPVNPYAGISSMSGILAALGGML